MSRSVFSNAIAHVRNAFSPANHGFGFTADMDNRGFPARSVAHFRLAFAKDMTWFTPSVSERQRFKAHPDVSKAADHLLAVSQEGSREYWVLENDWSGFPDPAEYLFIGFTPDKSIFAAGRFEDWPENWQRDDGLNGK